MSKFINLSGLRFGNLVVIERAEDRIYKSQKSRMWKCLCDCGNYSIASGCNLKNNKKTDCGCQYKQIKDLKDLRFGRLLVLKKSKKSHGIKSRSQYWLCECDCGKTISCSSHSLSLGLTNSCGCLHKDIVSKSAKKRKGIKNPKLSKGENIASINALYGKYKRRALKKKISFTISLNEFIEITQQPCFYCGKPPLQKSYNKDYDGIYTYNGIDRVDNEKGYEDGNIVPCCGVCNRMKWDMETSDFMKKIYEIFIYNKEVFEDINKEK